MLDRDENALALCRSGSKIATRSSTAGAGCGLRPPIASWNLLSSTTCPWTPSSGVQRKSRPTRSDPGPFSARSIPAGEDTATVARGAPLGGAL